ncbi:PLP-dependent aminotransferase family protein [Desulfovibrio sp. UCD-KL4C]|uniref:aminotransferase-like domain-containing protein n=1 Tax=Desulfovibrio sp. UCD-KL4C TaxID=2578120 RepID=UPI0025C2976A|nr:PLP-dependent aminotransferase family protein [Desulfovibrio sp. UCD-KL4C]
MWCPSQLGSKNAKYIAIVDALEADIRAGKISPGDKLPPQRELADMLSVNLTTISKAYREAERRGLVKGAIGRGTFISAGVSKTLEPPKSNLFATGAIEMGIVFSLNHLEPPLEDRIANLSAKRQLSEFRCYSEPAGLSEHLEIGTSWAKSFGFDIGIDRLVVTAGAQHALTCTLMACFAPGDSIAVDCLTYSGLKNLAAMMDIRLTPIEMDAEGMIPDRLRAACKSRATKGIYLMPAFHNPTAITMSAKRRRELVGIIKEHHLLLIEDDPYYFLASEAQPAMSSFVQDQSVFIGSFSKILHAGLRVAFVVASAPIRERLAAAVYNTIWMAPALNVAIICDAIVEGLIENVIQTKIKEAQRRNHIARSVLPFSANNVFNKGFYVWYQLPEPWPGYAFEAEARKRGVNINCAEQFAVGNPDITPAVRICLTATNTTQELESGLSRLAEIL